MAHGKLHSQRHDAAANTARAVYGHQSGRRRDCGVAPGEQRQPLPHDSEPRHKPRAERDDRKQQGSETHNARRLAETGKKRQTHIAPRARRLPALQICITTRRESGGAVHSPTPNRNI